MGLLSLSFGNECICRVLRFTFYSTGKGGFVPIRTDLTASTSPPSVSVIMATYNRSELLPYSIGSVRRQTRSDWELVVVGDACTDDTAQVVGELMQADPRIRFVNRDIRYGEQSGPNNDGVALARGRYLAFLNHDDLWLADHLARGIEALDRTGADIVFPMPVNIDRLGVPRLYRVSTDDTYNPEGFVPASYWLLRRNTADEIGPWRHSRDIWGANPSQDFLFRAWRSGKRLMFHRNVTCLVFSSGGRPQSYRLRDPSEASRWFARICDEPDLVQRLMIDLAVDTYSHEPHLWRDLGRQIRTALARAWWRSYVLSYGNPHALKGFVRYRRKGEWMERLHAYRGLPPRSRVRP
jgi:glycosyltransferase involved in cell wall biosynthesis